MPIVLKSKSERESMKRLDKKVEWWNKHLDELHENKDRKKMKMYEIDTREYKPKKPKMRQYPNMKGKH